MFGYYEINNRGMESWNKIGGKEGKGVENFKIIIIGRGENSLLESSWA